MRISRSGSKHRLLDALNLRFTGEVSFLEIYVAENIVDHVMGRSMDGRHMLQLDAVDILSSLSAQEWTWAISIPDSLGVERQSRGDGSSELYRWYN